MMAVYNCRFQDQQVVELHNYYISDQIFPNCENNIDGTNFHEPDAHFDN